MDYLSFLSSSRAESVQYIFLLSLVLLKYLLLNRKTQQKRLLESFESNLFLLSKPCLQGAISCRAVLVPLLSTPVVAPRLNALPVLVLLSISPQWQPLMKKRP